MQVSNINQAIPVNIVQSTTSKSPLKSGDSFGAKVVSIEENIITLQREDGSTIKAENLTGTSLKVGDSVTLLITSTNQNSATGSMTEVNGQPITQNVTDDQMQLINIGESSSSKNLSLANLFSKFNFPMTKQAFDNLVKIFESYPEIQEDLAVFMAANDIKPTDENIASLEHIGNLHQEIQTVVDEINNIVSHLPIEQFFTDKNDLELASNAEKAASKNSNFIDNNKSSTNQIINTSKGDIINITDSLDIETFLQTAVNDGSINQENIPQVIDQAINFVLSSLPNEEQSALVRNLLTSIVTNTIENLTSLNAANNKNLELNQLLESLPPEFANHIQELLPQIQALTNKFLTLYAVEDAKDLLFTKVNENLSGNMIKQTIENTPNKLLDLGNLKLSDSWQQLANNIKLGEQSMTYMQIPITIMNKEHTGELYVLKKRGGKNKQNKDGSTKVVFALNTENIGRFESIISANYLDLNLNIRLENQKIKSLVDNNLDMLERMLSKTKYNIVNLTTTTIDKRITVSNAHDFFGYKQLDIEI